MARKEGIKAALKAPGRRQWGPHAQPHFHGGPGRGKCSNEGVQGAVKRFEDSEGLETRD